MVNYLHRTRLCIRCLDHFRHRTYSARICNPCKRLASQPPRPDLPCGCDGYCHAPEHSQLATQSAIARQTNASEVAEDGSNSITTSSESESGQQTLRISAFPNEILMMVFDRLYSVDATALGLVSKHFYAMYRKVHPKLVRVSAICKHAYCSSCCQPTCTYTGLKECTLRMHMAKWFAEELQWSFVDRTFLPIEEEKASRLRPKA